MIGRLFIIFCIISVGELAKLPDYFTKCKLSDGECLLKNAVDNLPMIAQNGDKSFHIKTLKPFYVKTLNIQATPSLSVVLYQANIGEFETVHISEIKIDPVKEEFSFRANFEKISLISRYSLDGKILVLAISGDGKANITAINIQTEFRAKLETIEKDGSSYFKLSNTKLKGTKLEHVYYELTNLFNGDEALGKQMNLFLNENWFEVYKEVEGAIYDLIGSIVTNVINAYFTAIPKDELFIKEV